MNLRQRTLDTKRDDLIGPVAEEILNSAVEAGLRQAESEGY